MKDLAATIAEAKKLTADGGTRDATLAFLARSGLTFPEAVFVVRSLYGQHLKAARDICAASGHWPNPGDTLPTWRIRGSTHGETIEVSGDGAFDELAVKPWLHVERLTATSFWIRVGDAAFELTVRDGKVTGWRRIRLEADRQ